MIKFAKYMYSLGYDAAVREVLGTIDAIPLEKNHSNDLARAVNRERQSFKDYLHKKFDKNYKPPVDLEILERRI